MRLMKPCRDCGEPTNERLGRCSECKTDEARKFADRGGSSRSRGYDRAWDKLSERARRLQPWCSDCGAREDLQLDHLPETWERKQQGKVLRLRDTGGVVCGQCNRKRGQARGVGVEEGKRDPRR